MFAARIIGNVVCTRKDEKMVGLKMQIVQPVSLLTLEEEGKPVVAIDSVGAGQSELVLVVGGSSARLTDTTQNRPVDQVIMGIIDHIDIKGDKVFSKYDGEEEAE